MTAYYNENDKYAAQWLRNLISAGHIAPGDVDERSIEDVRPGDIAGYTQCHFFAGIGVWSYALRRAGWPDDRRVWTGSCPCQPFSAAGKGGGMADERHLWPAWFHLIAALRPDRIYGEQVASKDGLAWLDLVLSDVENADYTGRAFDLCAAGVGAPHIRQRLYWMADTNNPSEHTLLRTKQDNSTEDLRGGEAGRLVRQVAKRNEGQFDRISSTDAFWSAAEWIACRDGKSRPVEPGTFPLAYGAPASMEHLRGYGNAIVAPLAEEFIRATM